MDTTDIKIYLEYILFFAGFLLIVSPIFVISPYFWNLNYVKSPKREFHTYSAIEDIRKTRSGKLPIFTLFPKTAVNFTHNDFDITLSYKHPYQSKSNMISGEASSAQIIFKVKQPIFHHFTMMKGPLWTIVYGKAFKFCVNENDTTYVIAYGRKTKNYFSGNRRYISKDILLELVNKGYFIDISKNKIKFHIYDVNETIREHFIDELMLETSKLYAALRQDTVTTS